MKIAAIPIRKVGAALATVENNLKSLNHALDVVGSHRIANLQTKVYDDSEWSLFLVNRHEVRTQCLILPDKTEVQHVDQP